MSYYKVPLMSRAVTEDDLMRLPRGFRFHPTDEEIVIHYLIPKSLNSNFRAAAIGQADFNKCEPWDLPKKVNMGDTERYYYCQRDRKYPSGIRTNRATKAGYWKATGKDKEIYKGVGAGRELVGMKKTLVFYTGRAPIGEKTNWVMHEFRLQHGQFISIPKDDGWVVSKVFHKNINTSGGNNGAGNHRRVSSSNNPLSPMIQESDTFSIDDLLIDGSESLPSLVDPSAVHPMSHVQDLKRKAIMPISYGFQHQHDAIMQPNICHSNSMMDAYDNQLMNYDDPDYYFATLSETLYQTLDSIGNEDIKGSKNIITGTSTMDDYNCKVEQQCPLLSSASRFALQDLRGNRNNNGDDSYSCQEYNDFPTSTLGSMPDLSKPWN